MKLSEIQQDWSADSKINELELGREAIKVPTLHSKYLTILSNTKLQLRKAESDYYKLRQLKFRYYRGELTQKELEDNEWNQWQGNKPLKNEMDEFLQVDADLILLQDKVEYFKTVMYQLEQIIRSLNSRTWDIKNSIEWSKFTNGMM